MASRMQDNLSAEKLGDALQNILKVRKEAKEYIESVESCSMDRIDYFNYLLQQACMNLYMALEIVTEAKDD